MATAINVNSTLLTISSISFVAVTAIATAAKITLATASIVTVPLALNIAITEYTLAQMQMFEISPSTVALTLAGVILLGIATVIAGFIFLPLPIAAIFCIATIMVCANNFYRVDHQNDHDDGGYLYSYQAQVSAKSHALNERINTLIVEADEKMRADNEELFKKLIEFTKKRPELALEYKMIHERHKEILELNAAIDKLSP